MIWNRDDRFKQPSDEAQTYSCFAEYLRHQFRLSKKLSMNADYFGTAISQGESPKRSPGKKNSVSPEGSPTTKSKFLTHKIKVPHRQLAHAISVKEQYGQYGPGPAAYSSHGSLIKPTHNKVYCDPNFGGGSGKLNSREVYNGSTMKNQKGAFLNVKYRSTSAPPGGRKPLNGASSPGKKKSYDPDLISRQNPALNHNRYPPLSEKMIKRWKSVAHDSYKPPVKYHKL